MRTRCGLLVAGELLQGASSTERLRCGSLTNVERMPGRRRQARGRTAVVDGRGLTQTEQFVLRQAGLEQRGRGDSATSARSLRMMRPAGVVHRRANDRPKASWVYPPARPPQASACRAPLRARPRAGGRMTGRPPHESWPPASVSSPTPSTVAPSGSGRWRTPKGGDGQPRCGHHARRLRRPPPNSKSSPAQIVALPPETLDHTPLV